MGMYIQTDDLYLCSSCACIAANGDSSGCDDSERGECERGVADLGPHLVFSGGDEEIYEARTCDACRHIRCGYWAKCSILAQHTLTAEQIGKIRAGARDARMDDAGTCAQGFVSSKFDANELFERGYDEDEAYQVWREAWLEADRKIAESEQD